MVTKLVPLFDCIYGGHFHRADTKEWFAKEFGFFFFLCP